MKTFVKIFHEDALERRSPTGGWSQIQPPQGDLELHINKWLLSNDLRLTDIRMSDEFDPVVQHAGGESRRRATRCVLLYCSPDPEYVPPEVGKTARILAPLPLPAGATAPTVDVIMHTAEGERPGQAMCGVFGVPEGQKLNVEDEEAAPLPLFSPDLDLAKFRTLFGNVKTKDKDKEE